MERGRLIEIIMESKESSPFRCCIYIYISRYFVEFKCGNLSILDWKVLQRCRYIV